MTTTIEKPVALPTKTREQNIEEQVLKSLGTVPGYLRMKIIPLFDDNFRVNVFVVVNHMESRIVDDIRILYSFFITADKAGNIMASSPKLR